MKTKPIRLRDIKGDGPVNWKTTRNDLGLTVSVTVGEGRYYLGCWQDRLVDDWEDAASFDDIGQALDAINKWLAVHADN